MREGSAAVFLTKEEVAQWLKVSQRTVDRHVKEGKIPPPVYVGTRPRWLKETVSKWFLRDYPVVVCHV